MIKKIPALLVLLVVVPVFSGCNDGLPDDAVAKVDDRIITREWFDKTVEMNQKQYGPKFAGDEAARNRLVQQKVLDEVAVLEAEELHLTANDEEIEQQVNKIRQQYESEEKFQQNLAASGVTMEEFRENIRRWLLATKLRNEVMKGMPMPSDEEALEYYNQNRQLFVNKSFEEVKPFVKTQMIEATGLRESYWLTWLGKVMTDHEIIYAEGFGPVEESAQDTATTPAGTTAPAP